MLYGLSWLFTFHLLMSEYRVFDLLITNEASGQERRVQSILDPWQYGTYHPLKRDEKIEMIDTWMCWRRRPPKTPLCQRPGGLVPLKSESEADAP